MDRIDRRILEILSENAAATATEMVPHLNLSIPAINKRIQRLRESGVISRFTVLTDAELVGKPICAFIVVVLQRGTDFEKLMQYVQEDQDILECCGVTGEYDYLLKICVANMGDLQKKINYMKKTAGVVKSHTMLSLTQYKHKVAVLPDEIQERKSEK